ncbi:putative cytochrome c1 heme lyase [Neolecta irregularis DAH-3]|uniref:Holocytochrome c-type synthase n=1 Tax=Neolecta irregularis (strain DAH-3) TaxID=1198029 RepID=A0A1U7LJR4_NEOID|nr:putative cytochrome c1 heme lyase [Neolecta irregularis DAH-3]|eukprot:OLL22906.1 putative cytochrome c1 heme lyase [Neolecta irregularis DAH-3]
MSCKASSDQPKCPVDHSSRETWLLNAATSSDSSTVEISPLNQMPVHPQQESRTSQKTILSKSRQLSSIPRSDQSSQNWIYPSEQMFFDSMIRKQQKPEEKDMKYVVPVHNAVNERTWMEIMKWEKGRGGTICGGPKLLKFEGNPQKLSPKARFMKLLGYEPPFDRHDWIVDRCGKKVHYVIDYYSGKPNERRPIAPSFYIDARPAFDFEGAQMRISRFFSELF